jgi:hypothetical protein
MEKNLEEHRDSLQKHRSVIAKTVVLDMVLITDII